LVSLPAFLAAFLDASWTKPLPARFFYPALHFYIFNKSNEIGKHLLNKHRAFSAIDPMYSHFTTTTTGTICLPQFTHFCGSAGSADKTKNPHLGQANISSVLGGSGGIVCVIGFSPGSSPIPSA
jgi:hypothetical protein